MRALAQRSGSPPRALRVVLMLVLAAVTSSWTIAWLAPCTAHERDVAAEVESSACCPKQHEATDVDEHDEEGDCSCPLDCGPCCAGMPPSAIITVLGVAPALLPEYTLLSFAAVPDAQREGTRIDILHVPRS